MWACTENPSLPLFDCGCAGDGAIAARESSVAQRAAAIGPITSPAAAYWLLEPLVADSPTELAHVTTLDGRCVWQRTRLIARGNRASVLVPLPRVLREAFASSSRYVILTHNHPSGWAWPSDADGELTESLDRACFDAGLVLLDHVILARGEFFSFREGTLWTIRS